MPRIQVLLDRKGTVLGTAQPAPQTNDDRVPVASLVPGEDQQVIEVTVTDAEARLDADSLLKSLKAKKLR
jgi:hypothetical protein